MKSNNTYKAVAIAIAPPTAPGGMWAVLDFLFRMVSASLNAAGTTTTTTTTR